MIETRRLENVVFIQTILSFVLSRKIINILLIVFFFFSHANLVFKSNLIYLLTF